MKNKILVDKLAELTQKLLDRITAILEETIYAKRLSDYPVVSYDSDGSPSIGAYPASRYF